MGFKGVSLDINGFGIKDLRRIIAILAYHILISDNEKSHSSTVQTESTSNWARGIKISRRIRF